MRAVLGLIGLAVAVVVIALLARQQMGVVMSPATVPAADGAKTVVPGGTPSVTQARALAAEIERQADQGKARLDATESASK